MYRLGADGALAGLQVEAFVIEEALSQPWRLELVTPHERADLDLDAMLAQPATLVTVLADGSEHRRGGLVLDAYVIVNESLLTEVFAAPGISGADYLRVSDY